MSNISRELAVKVLDEKGEVVITCNGSSMKAAGLYKGDSLYIKKVDISKLRIKDSVFVRVGGALQVHRLADIDKVKDKYCISNSFGWVNDWVNPDRIYGLCVKVNDTVIVSDADLEKR